MAALHQHDIVPHNALHSKFNTDCAAIRSNEVLTLVECGG
jgi:hypothetical protein